MTRPALLRAAVAPLLATVFGVLSVGGMSFGAVPLGPVAATASAAPLTPALAPAVAPAMAPGNDKSTDPDRPVRIDVSRFEPRTVTPGAVVTVTGTLTNTGASTITDLTLRLQRGEGVTSRAELAAIGQEPDPATTVQPSFHDVPGELPPGGELPFIYAVPAADLRLDRDAVYPALLNLNGAVAGEQQRRVGELSTFVVRQPVAPAASTTVAWLWPLVEPSHRLPTGDFRDDGLADAVRNGGRLDRALAVLERLPTTVVAGEPVPSLSVTLAIDPALVEELEVMAAGPYRVGGIDGAGRGTDEAAAYLERLRSVAADHPVVALAYGDVDADALTTAGLSDVLVRTLPGTGRGTAQDPPGAPSSDGASASSSPGGESPSPAPAGDGGTGAGARILTDALGVEPRTDLAWAPGGSLRADTLATMQAEGVDRVVLGAGGLSGGDAAVGLDGGVAAAHTSVATTVGPLDALVADPRLADVVGSAEHVAGGPRMAEQRYLAELAALGLQAPEGSEQTVLVAPPRLVDAGPDGAGAMMADTAAGLPWLHPGSTEGLAGGPAAAAGDLVDPVDAQRLDPAGLADVVGAVALRNDLAGAVVGNADAALADHDAAIARATSAAWRADPEGFRAGAAALRAAIDSLRGRVTLLAPVDGTYSLASTDAPLVLTVRNDLPFAVQVLLEVRTRGNVGLSIGDIGATTLVPGERKTLQVPTQVRQSGGFAVTAELTTPSGAPLGKPVHIQVKSTAYGSISLLITFGAAALLALLFLRRLVRFLRRRRRTTAAGDQPGTAPEGVGTQPPTRSPV